MANLSPLAEIASARRALALAINSLPTHHPEIIRRAATAFYWAIRAVQESALAPGDAEEILLEMAVRTALLPEEFVLCAMLFYRMDICGDILPGAAGVRAAISYYIESYVYHKSIFVGRGGLPCR